MKAGRATWALGLLILAGIPMTWPIFGASSLHLAWNTFLFSAGTLGLALPLGVLLAVLLFRTDLPARTLFLWATVLVLFIPLPLIVSGWQALAGGDGLLRLPFWGENADRPWSAGLLPAIWVQGLAGLPWAVLIVGIGLTGVEKELEEEALLTMGPWQVLLRVTLPRARGSIAAAAVWLGVQTAADISVTDMLLVPTFAEEIHTQFTMGGPDNLARTLLLAVPGVALIWALLLVLVPWLEKSLPPLQLSLAVPRIFPLGKARWLWFAMVLLVGALFFLVPVASLLWKLGLTGHPRSWSAPHATHQFLAELRLNGGQVLLTLGVALATGALSAALALILCWQALERPRMRILLWVATTLAWALPAPVVGILFGQLIMAVIRWLPIEPLLTLLYYGPYSPVPIVVVHILRFFPFAVALLWPVVRLVSPELRDAARLDGAGPWRELLHVFWPSTRQGFAAALLAVTALALGEVGAAARVETPGSETFAKLLFDRMHYGVDKSVAALALVLLAELPGTFILGAGIMWLWRKPRIGP